MLGWVGFRPVGLKNTGVVSKQNYGFNIFWRSRLIASNEKVGFRAHTEFQRLLGELHLDDFPVTHNKRDIVRDSDAYNALAGPPDKEDPEHARDYTKGELWPRITRLVQLMTHKDQERRVAVQKVRRAAEMGDISINTARSLKKKLYVEEVSTKVIDAVLSSERTKTQTRIGAFSEERGTTARTHISAAKTSEAELGSISIDLDAGTFKLADKTYPLAVVDDEDEWVLCLMQKTRLLNWRKESDLLILIYDNDFIHSVLLPVSLSGVNVVKVFFTPDVCGWVVFST